MFNRLDKQEDIYVPVKNRFNGIVAVKPVSSGLRNGWEMRSEDSLMLYLGGI